MENFKDIFGSEKVVIVYRFVSGEYIVHVVSTWEEYHRIMKLFSEEPNKYTLIRMNPVE